MKKVSVGSAVFAFGPYARNPIPLKIIIEKLGKMGFDGISLGGFKPHAHPDLYPTMNDRKHLVRTIKNNNLEVAEYGPNLWGINSLTQTDDYFKLFNKFKEFVVDCGFTMIRIDSGAPPILPENMSYKTALEKVVDLFCKVSDEVEREGIKIVWEFEPGFIFNKPSEIIEIYENVNRKNFKILLDTCHANMCAVVGARQMGEKETLKGGVIEFIEMLKGKIGLVHLIDSDNTLHDNETSTHAPFGLGVLNFDEIIPNILKAGYTEKWWVIDLCFWPNAWKLVRQCKEFVDKLNDKYCID
jgi:sugar phosphate isomerase/epimerase